MIRAATRYIMGSIHLLSLDRTIVMAVQIVFET